MQKMALQKLRPGWIISALVAFLLMAGCVDILNGPPVSPESGKVAITIANPARTVSPRLDQFSRIEITFQRKDGSGVLAPLDATGGAAVIYLPPGTWELTASAYNTGDPPEIVAQAKNTLTRAGSVITGETNFVLAPTGTGAGTLEYAVALPPGLDIDSGWIRIEQNGEALEERAVNGETNGEFSLKRGRYIVDITLDKGDGTAAVCREAAVILPGLVTIINFAPALEDFLDPETRAALTTALEFRPTVKNSSLIKVDEAGGEGASLTQVLYAKPAETALVFFTLQKAASQTITVSGPDATRVTQGVADGSSPGATLAVFTVDTAGLMVGNSMLFTLALTELYKENVNIAVTLILANGAIQTLYFESIPNKRIYIQGENFDPAGMVLGGTYTDGNALAKPDISPVSGYTVAGFDTSSLGEKTIYVTIRGVTATLGKTYYSPGGISITVEPPGYREIYFDYGLRRSAQDAQPDRYSVPMGRALVLAPVKWHIPDDAEYEWTVDGATQPPTHPEKPEYFRFTPGAQGNYAITVTAKINGQPVSTASTTVECVVSEGTYKRTGGTNGTALKLSWVYAPGQFTPGASRSAPSLGAWGGYAVYKFDHSVSKSSQGKEIKITGNAFGIAGDDTPGVGWAEPGTVWVMQDENGNGAPDDTWYELAGSHTLLPETKRRYAVTYYAGRPNGSHSNSWIDNLGSIGPANNYPTGSPSPMTFVGTGLPGGWYQPWNGYVDVNDNGHVSIRNAIQVDGNPIDLAYIDFVKVQCGLNLITSTFGEISTEIYEAPWDATLPNPSMLLTGASAGNGQYSYQFINNSGYNLNITLGVEPEFVLNAGDSVTKTIAFNQAYYDCWGGSVTATKATGKVTFADGPGGDT
jgi:hypothetical protein